jgi:hypothetical protein
LTFVARYSLHSRSLFVLSPLCSGTSPWSIWFFQLQRVSKNYQGHMQSRNLTIWRTHRSWSKNWMTTLSYIHTLRSRWITSNACNFSKERTILAAICVIIEVSIV